MDSLGKCRYWCDECENEVDEYGDPVEEGTCDCSYGPRCDTCGYGNCDESC